MGENTKINVMTNVPLDSALIQLAELSRLTAALTHYQLRIHAWVSTAQPR
jgi:hypothetical protein